MRRVVGVSLSLLSLVWAALAVASPKAGPLPMQADLGRASDDPDVTCADLKTEPTRWGVVILGSEEDIATAERRARELSVKTGVPFSREGYSIDPKTRRAVYHRGHDGEYVARWWRGGQCDECITIERSSGYTSFTPNLFVIVGAVGLDEAPETFAKYRERVPAAYVKYSTLRGDTGGYGVTSGCMEWDVIVLARTKLFSEAEAIAKDVSKLSGIPYVAKPAVPTAQAFPARSAPYPHISVESDAGYGEQQDSPYFLVVGGELTFPENASLELFKRYQRIVPKAYRMKRALHVCGA